MIVRGTHTTRYSYDEPITLERHTVRLQPRTGSGQTLRHFAIHVEPEPSAQTETLDLEGNPVHYFWFLGQTRTLSIETSFEVETRRTNPFDFIPVSASELPMTHQDQHHPHLRPVLNGDPSEIIRGLSARVAARSHGSPVDFVTDATRWIQQHVKKIVRRHGAPHTPEETLRLQSGACRDSAVLLMALCRCMNIPARFVSGYHHWFNRSAEYDLHAWVEAWIPGGGWRGFDPSQGLAVADQHVALAAAVAPESAAPVTGSYRGSSPPRNPEHEIELSMVQ